MSSTPSCTSVSSSRRESSVGPMSEIVMRTGSPWPPSISQKRVGQPSNAKPSMPKRLMRSCMSSESLPASHMPVTSPLASAINTGTPAFEKPSAITLSVTVLPVPDAPAMRPWRFAWLRRRFTCFSPAPIQMALSWNMRGSFPGVLSNRKV